MFLYDKSNCITFFFTIWEFTLCIKTINHTIQCQEYINSYKLAVESVSLLIYPTSLKQG